MQSRSMWPRECQYVRKNPLFTVQSTDSGRLPVGAACTRGNEAFPERPLLLALEVGRGLDMARGRCAHGDQFFGTAGMQGHGLVKIAFGDAHA